MRSPRILLTSCLISLLTLILGLFLYAGSAQAAQLGIHLLQPEEINVAIELFHGELIEFDQRDNLPSHDAQIGKTRYVTIPFPLTELDKPQEAAERWQKFFNTCAQHQIIPLVRLTTRFDLAGGVWAVPTRAEIVASIDFLNNLTWPPGRQHLIIFNEVNHDPEWGGQADPVTYASLLAFAANWAHHRSLDFFVLPAGLDLAAPNGPATTEAFTYLDQMLEFNPQIFDYVDGWTSHSYPNPAFSSAPTKTGQNSLSGYQQEWDWLVSQTTRTSGLPIFITETGWEDNAKTRLKLREYYQTAWEKIWRDDPRLVAVTPFVLQGAPGPFSKFSLLDKDGQPTRHYDAFSRILFQQ